MYYIVRDNYIIPTSLSLLSRFISIPTDGLTVSSSSLPGPHSLCTYKSLDVMSSSQYGVDFRVNQDQDCEVIGYIMDIIIIYCLISRGSALSTRDKS